MTRISHDTTRFAPPHHLSFLRAGVSSSSESSGRRQCFTVFCHRCSSSHRKSSPSCGSGCRGGFSWLSAGISSPRGSRARCAHTCQTCGRPCSCTGMRTGWPCMGHTSQCCRLTVLRGRTHTAPLLRCVWQRGAYHVHIMILITIYHNLSRHITTSHEGLCDTRVTHVIQL